MRYFTYLLAVIFSLSYCYTFKPVEAQAQKSMSSRGSIGSTTSMNMLKNIAPTRDGALISIDSAYMVNNQWYKAIFQYNKNETRPANGSRVYVTVMGRTGAWNVYKFGIDYTDIFRLDSVLNTRVTVSVANASYQPKGTYVVTETDPLYTANGATKSYANSLSTRINADSLRLISEIVSAERISNKVNTYATGNTSTAQYPSFAALQLALATTVRGVTLGGGSATFTTTSLLVGATVSVTIPLGVTMPDINYQVATPTVISSGGINLLGNLAINSITKNTTNVVVVLKNTALLAVAISGTIDIVALKVL